MTEDEKQPMIDKPVTLGQAAVAGGAGGALGGLWLSQFTLIGPVRTYKQDFTRVTAVTAGAALFGAAALVLLGALGRRGREKDSEGGRCARAVEGDRGTADTAAVWTGKEQKKQAADAVAPRGAAPAR